MVIDRNDIDAFVELDVMALTNHIEVLTKEIEEGFHENSNWSWVIRS